MPALCAAVNCNNRAVKAVEGDDPRQRRSFHKFPLKNPALLKSWLISMKRQGFTPTENHVICSDHFTEDCFEVHFEVRRLCRPSCDYI